MQVYRVGLIGGYDVEKMELAPTLSLEERGN